MFLKKEKKEIKPCIKQIEDNLEYAKITNKNVKFDKELDKLVDDIKFGYPSKNENVLATEKDILKLTEDLKIHIALSRRDERIQGVIDEIKELIFKRNSMI